MDAKEEYEKEKEVLSSEARLNSWLEQYGRTIVPIKQKQEIQEETKFWKWSAIIFILVLASIGAMSSWLVYSGKMQSYINSTCVCNDEPCPSCSCPTCPSNSCPTCNCGDCNPKLICSNQTWT